MKPKERFIPILLLALYSLAGISTAQDQNWDVFDLPNFNGDVNALAITADGLVFAGGRFGGIPGGLNYVASWDGHHWAGLGEGATNGTPSPVAALVTQGNVLYVGGEFAGLNGQSVGHVAKWDGVQWSSLGSGANAGVAGNVYALATDGTNVYVGGTFSTAGGIAAANVAKWDGTSWAALGSGLGGANSRVTCLAIGPDGSLYGGGDFTNSGAASVSRIARWDGSRWLSLGAGVNDTVQAVAGDGQYVYVGGSFTNAGTVKAKCIARWDGSQWIELGGGVTGGAVYGLAVDGSDIYLAGGFTEAGGVPAFGVAKWNGVAWNALSSGLAGPDPTIAYSIIAQHGNVYVGGNFFSAGDANSLRVARWDGQKWSALNHALDGGNPTTVNAIAVQGTNVLVGGDFLSAGGTPAQRIARWDGQGWSYFGTVSSNGFDLPVLAIAVSPQGQVIAGGRFSQAAGIPASRIARWDGARWSSLGNGVTSEGWVDAIALAPDGSVFAGGSFSSIGTITANNLARWDGTNWLDVGGGLTLGNVSAVVKGLVMVGTNLYVGGAFNLAGNVAVAGLARWDGSTWTPVGGGVTDPGFTAYVSALAYDGANLWVGGSFTQAGTVSAARIARWDGQTWSALGTGTDSEVDAIAAFGNLLFVGGNFTTVGGQSIAGIAQWDGNSWSGLGSGLGGTSVRVNALGTTGTELFLGGNFSSAGSKLSNQFAGWALSNHPPAISILSPGSNTTFPFHSSITITAAASDDDGAVKKVDFFANQVLLGTVSNSPYTLTWSNVFTGDYLLSAQATDNLGAISNSSAVQIRVNPPTNDLPPVVTLTNPTNGSVFIGGSNLQLQADASDLDGNVTRVDFYAGVVLIGSVSNSPYSLTWSNLALGQFSIDAVATDDFGAVGTSAPVQITIVAPNDPPHVAWLSPQDGDLFTLPASITLNATAFDTDGQIVSVDFLAGSTVLASFLPAASYTFSWSPSEPGVIPVTVRATDNQGAVSSATVDVVINGPDTFSTAQALPANTAKANFWVPDAPVRAILETNGVVYLAGDFTHVGLFTTGNVVLNPLAHPADWSYPIVNGTVSCVVGDGTGGYYVGGLFNSLGGVSRTNLAHVLADKSVDPNWNPGPDAQVTTLCFLNGVLYLAGDFSSVSAQARTRLAAVDASAGIVLSWNPAPSGPVNVLLAGTNVVYAGGGFTNIGGVPRGHLAALDPSSGSPLAWNPNASDLVSTLALADNQLIVAGSFTNIAGAARAGLAGIDLNTGAATAFNPNPLGQINTVAVQTGVVFVGGFFTQIGYPNPQSRHNLAALDPLTGQATAWNPNPNDGVNQILPNGLTVYVSGPFSNIGGADRNHFAEIDATSGLATDLNLLTTGSVSAMGTSSNRLFLAGSSALAQLQRNHVAALDEATGTATDWNPNCNATVWSLACLSNHIYLGGDFTQVGTLPRSSIVGVDAQSGIPWFWTSNITGSVRTILVHSNDLYLGGYMTTPAGRYLSAIHRDTGTVSSWNPTANDGVVSLVELNNLIYAAGFFTAMGGQPRNYVAAVDPETGSVANWDANANNLVLSLTVGGSTLYAGGVFTQIGGRGRVSLAALDPLTGKAFPWLADTDQTVEALTYGYSTIYAGGQYSTIGGQSRINLAGVDTRINNNGTTAWAPYVDNVFVSDSIIYCLTATPNTLFVGGKAKFGAELRPYFAAFDFPPRLQSFGASAAGGIRFDVAGAYGNDYILQVSTDLRNWTSMRTNSGPFSYQDDSFNPGKKFYRVVSGE